MKAVLVFLASALLLLGCASTGPVVLWQGDEPTQQVSEDQFNQALFNAKAIPGAEIEESPIQTSVKVPNASSNPTSYTLYIFTKPASYAHPAAARMTLQAGKSDGKGPDFRFLQVGDKPEFKKFVREILMAGMLFESSK